MVGVNSSTDVDVLTQGDWEDYKESIRHQQLILVYNSLLALTRNFAFLGLTVQNVDAYRPPQKIFLYTADRGQFSSARPNDFSNEAIHINVKRTKIHIAHCWFQFNFSSALCFVGLSSGVILYKTKFFENVLIRIMFARVYTGISCPLK